MTPLVLRYTQLRPLLMGIKAVDEGHEVQNRVIWILQHTLTFMKQIGCETNTKLNWQMS